jgi:hypothetical protein
MRQSYSTHLRKPEMYGTSQSIHFMLHSSLVPLSHNGAFSQRDCPGQAVGQAVGPHYPELAHTYIPTALTGTAQVDHSQDLSAFCPAVAPKYAGDIGTNSWAERCNLRVENQKATVGYPRRRKGGSPHKRVMRLLPRAAFPRAY